MMKIPFNKPYLTGKEAHYLYQAVYSGKISGDGMFTKKCQRFFEERYGFKKCLLTTSCTAALEMAAILLDVKPGDEVIVPSFTFVSTANAFVLRGANIIFADSGENHPNIDPDRIENLISPKTKAIVVVHYAGVGCDMQRIMRLAEKHGLFVVEDAAQAVDSYYLDSPLGGIGHLASFSFHETKNVISGEGGMLVINDERFIKRAEIIREKGTNRSAFFRGEVDKYNWVDIGSSFLPSEIIAAFLFAQLENIEAIQARRIAIWNTYYQALKPLEEKGFIKLPALPAYAFNSGHMFYIICRSKEERESLLAFLKEKGVLAVFHYLSLHNSPYYKEQYKGMPLLNADKFSLVLARLPLFYELTDEEIGYIVALIFDFYGNK